MRFQLKMLCFSLVGQNNTERFFLSALTTSPRSFRPSLQITSLHSLGRPPRQSSRYSMVLHVSTEPLATKGDWTAYLDEEGTGLIYYFNGKTGESVWEPPVSDFPAVTLTPAMRAKAQLKQNEYVRKVERERQKQQQNDNNKSTFLSSILSSNDETSSRLSSSMIETISAADASESVGTADVRNPKQQQQLQNDWFNSVFEDVIQKPKENAPKNTDASRRKSISNAEVMEATRNRMQRDFFDRMFSSGRNIISGVVSSSATTASSSSDTSTPPEPQQLSFVESTPLSTAPEQQPQQQQQTPLTLNPPPSTVVTEVAISPPTVEIASFLLPHPAKARWGGEDAVFVKGRTFGVFDGVSGAEKRDGIPLYSKTLAMEMEKLITQLDSTGTTGLSIPQLSKTLLTAAEIADAKSTGASTAIVASITADGFLRVLNVGDSTCILIRNGRVSARSREISHYFECPYQLSVDSPDRPRDGTKLNIELQRGDVIFMASDGVFDNIPVDQIVQIITEATAPTLATLPINSLANGAPIFSNSASQQQQPIKVSKSTLRKIAKKIADRSRKVSFDRTALTPYARLAKRYNEPGYEDGMGGKIDDISCIVARYE